MSNPMFKLAWTKFEQLSVRVVLAKYQYENIRVGVG